ncbi:MAG: hypothetical protein ACREUW_07025 [Burkholderiales bacterium]
MLRRLLGLIAAAGRDALQTKEPAWPDLAPATLDDLKCLLRGS